MRHTMLLALLLLPSVALAGNVSFTSHGQTGPICTKVIGNNVCRTGDFRSGSISGLLLAPVEIDVVGSMNTIDLTLLNLSCSSSTLCTFTEMSVEGFHNGIVLFEDAGAVTGKVIKTTTSAEISGFTPGHIFTVFFDGSFSGTTLTGGHAAFTFPPVQKMPEPSAIEGLLLGAGVLTLFWAGHKFNLPILPRVVS